MSYTKLRSFVHVGIPGVKDLSAQGVYNFFTPDEKVSEDTALQYQGVYADNGGSVGQNKVIYTRSDGSQVAENNLSGVVPRYILLNFQRPTDVNVVGNLNYDLEMKRKNGLVLTADEIQSPHDVSTRFTDLSIEDRILEKLNYASLFDVLAPIYSESSLFQDSLNPSLSSTTVCESYLGNGVRIRDYQKQMILEMVNVNIADKIKDVNELNEKTPTSKKIQDSKTMSLFGKLDRKKFSLITKTTIDKKRLSKEVLNSEYEYDGSLDGLKKKEIGDLEIAIDCETTQINPNTDKTSVELAGYMIERYETSESTFSSEPERTYFISRPNVSSFADVRVKYGVTYTYTVRCVYKITHTITDNDGIKKELNAYITSEPTDPVESIVEEFTPPNAPDGVMYNFNFSERRGLRISWQYPVGRQRDTKYFQIFRRRSILEPFTCIGMLDFDNSEIKTAQREYIRPDKIFTHQSAITYFEDPDFKKDDTFIYAVAAVDAHGFTSGYSVQTKVSFIRTENRLVLKRISKQGAPKQYPNFFVDPDEDPNTFVNTITQDAIKTSGFDRMKVYFDPDGMNYKRKDGDILPIFYSNGPSSNTVGQNAKRGVYKLSIINLDRQKSKNIEITIDDARGTGYFPAQ